MEQSRLIDIHSQIRTGFLWTVSMTQAGPDVGGQGQRKSRQLCLVLVRPDGQQTDPGQNFLETPDKNEARTGHGQSDVRTRTVRRLGRSKIFDLPSPDRFLVPRSRMSSPVSPFWFSIRPGNLRIRWNLNTGPENPSLPIVPRLWPKC